MRRWAETAEAVRATRKTSEKSAIVAAYLTLFSVYQTQQALGEGASGEVLLALDSDIRRMVAVKRLKDEGAPADTLLTSPAALGDFHWITDASPCPKAVDAARTNTKTDALRPYRTPRLATFML